MKLNTLEKLVYCLRRRLIFALLLEASKLATLSIAIFLFVILPIRRYLSLDKTSFCIIAGIFLIAVSYVFIKYVFFLFFKINSVEKMARWLEKNLGLFNGDLISGIQFDKNRGLLEKYELSTSLTQAHIERVINQIDIKQILNDKAFYSSVRLGKYWLYIVLLLVLPVSIFGNFYADSLYFAYRDFFDPIKPLNEKIFVRPGNISVVYGENVSVQTVAFLDDNVEPFINFRKKNHDWQRCPMRKASAYRFSYELKKIDIEYDYSVQILAQKSQIYKISVINYPVILGHRIKYEFPEYVNWQPLEEQRRHFDDISCLKGTKINLSITVNNNLKNAWILMDGNKISFDSIEKNRASISFFVDVEIEYTIVIMDIFGNNNRSIKPYKIKPILDKPPSVRIIKPQTDIEVPEDMTVEIKYSASDDIGLGLLKLVYNIQGYEKKSVVLNTDTKDKYIDGSYEWDLTKLRLAPADVVTYKISVSDIYPPPDGPNISFSDERMLRFPSMVEMYKRKTEAFDNFNDTLTQLKNKPTNLLEKIQRLYKKLNASEDLTWADKQTAANMSQELTDIQNTLTQNNRMLENQLREKQIAKEVIEKYSEIQQLMDNLLTDDMKKAFSELQKMLENADLFEQIKKGLENAETSLEEYRDSLDRALELLKRLSFQNQLMELLETSRATLAQQQKLNKGLEKWAKNKRSISESDRDYIQKGVSEINRFFDYLDTTIKKTSENARLEKFDSSENMDKLEKSFNEYKFKQMVENMKNQVGMENIETAHNTGKSIKNGLNGLIDSIEKILNQWSLQRELVEGILDITDRIVRVGYELDLLVKSMQQYHGKSMKKNIEHAKQMFFLEQELGRIIFAAENLSKKSTIIDSSYYDILEEIAKDLLDQKESVFKKGNQAVIPLIENRVADTYLLVGRWVSLLELLSRLQQQGGQGGGMPNLQDYFDKLKEISEKQENINNQSAKMPDFGKSNNMSLSQYIGQLASEQKMLAEALSKLSGGTGGRKELIGDLDDIVSKMEESAKMIKNNKFGSNLKKEQHKILTRLLDAQKSLKKREKSKKRKSQTAVKTQYEVSPEELDKKWLRHKMQNIIKNQSRSYIPSDYRELVEQYFQILIEQK